MVVTTNSSGKPKKKKEKKKERRRPLLTVLTVAKKPFVLQHDSTPVMRFIYVYIYINLMACIYIYIISYITWSFSNAYSWEKICIHLDWDCIQWCSQMLNRQYISIDLGNGLAPNRRQDIIWNNHDSTLPHTVGPMDGNYAFKCENFKTMLMLFLSFLSPSITNRWVMVAPKRQISARENHYNDITLALYGVSDQPDFV